MLIDAQKNKLEELSQTFMFVKECLWLTKNWKSTWKFKKRTRTRKFLGRPK